MAYHTNEMDYMDGVTASFYYDNIMAFTPKGKCIVLPKNATALDFAFEIHTELGIHAVYARINGKLSSVKTILHRGDCVEIGTADDSMPESDWIHHVLTYKAKRSLGTALSWSISVAPVAIHCQAMRLSVSKIPKDESHFTNVIALLPSDRHPNRVIP